MHLPHATPRLMRAAPHVLVLVLLALSVTTSLRVPWESDEVRGLRPLESIDN